MKIKSLLLIVACVVLTILSGVLRGMIDQRWGTVPGMEEAAERVESFPLDLGDWKADASEDLDEDAAQQLQCKGSTLRNYVHQRTGEVVSVILLVGPAAPLAQHTAPVCYRSSNFSTKEPLRGTVITDVNGAKHDFSVITFTENKMGKRPLRVYYAWNDDGKWVAPSTPRTAFAGKPMLYKIQLATNSLGDEETADAALRFLSENLPTLEAITD